MDIQTILIFILAILTINLIAVGVYVIMVLRDFRETIRKANEVLDNVHDVTDTIANPVTTIAGIIAGVTKSVKAVRAISSLIENKEEEEE